MATRSVATVFGGSGFIGRYVVKRLAAAGHVVRVAVRDPEAALFLKPMGAVGQIVPLYASCRRRGRRCARAVEGADLVVNLVGILAEQAGRRFPAHPGRGRRARRPACGAPAGVARLVQVSAIGADPGSPSVYAPQQGGRASRRCWRRFRRPRILRPSMVFGPEDQFFNRFAAMAAASAVHAGDRGRDPVPAGLCRRRGRRGDGGADRDGRGRADLRARRPAGLDVPRDDGLDPAADRAASRGWSRCRWASRALQAADPGAAAGQAADPGPVAAAGAGQRGLARDARAWPNWAIVPTPVELVVPAYLPRFRPGGGGGSGYAA